MPYFFSRQKLSLGQQALIDADEAKHLLLSLRVKQGELINLQGPDEKRYECEVIKIMNGDLLINPLRQLMVPKEFETKVALFQSFIKESALDFVLQKGTELGVSKIVLFNSANTANKLSLEKFTQKLIRWNKITLEAIKQCGWVKAPKIEFSPDITSAAKVLGEFKTVILLDPDGVKLKDSTLKDKKEIAIIVGPEGGFKKEEIELLKKQPNTINVSLGPVFLRAETAAISALAIIGNLIE